MSSSPSESDGTALAKEKAARTEAQRKLDSNIVLAIKQSRKEPPFDKPTQLQPHLDVRPDGTILVDISATVSKELLSAIEASAGKVLGSFESAKQIRAIIPLAKAEALAARADITFIAPGAQPTTD